MHKQVQRALTELKSATDTQSRGANSVQEKGRREADREFRIAWLDAEILRRLSQDARKSYLEMRRTESCKRDRA
jgi:hypothetical protein